MEARRSSPQQAARFPRLTFYEPGIYRAPYFSVCRFTEYHPGLYVSPKAADISGNTEYAGYGLVKVEFEAKNAIHAGGKWRVRTFEVTEVIVIEGAK